METVKKTKEYTIFKKRSGRYALKNALNKPINAKEKEEILLKEKLITKCAPQAKPAEAAAAS